MMLEKQEHRKEQPSPLPLPVTPLPLPVTPLLLIEPPGKAVGECGLQGSHVSGS